MRANCPHQTCWIATLEDALATNCNLKKLGRMST
eukprot:CAMPEP_0171204406 /NCGR_PEP_ID=MMETSP0790-20130122/26026_1 /TAXON_ID=2925 /ORGANISM="Alexandrium catenella, Strain OF101" /LENGTH=33 /DNA_ID= /DNA_START= /DNA_END= /DNA_ORIENTATION=